MRKLYTKLTTSVLTRAFLSNQSKKSQARCSLASHIYKPQIISKDGQDVTWFARDSQGRLFQATFNTTGAAVAVQSVLNFCDSQE